MIYLVDIAAEGMWTKHRFVLGTEHLDAELANIRLALTWLLEQGPDAAEVSMRLADVATFYFRMRGMLPEGIAWVKRALALTDEPSYRYNITLASLGFNLWMVGELDEAEDVLLRARDLVSATTIRSHIAATHFYLALVYWRRGPEYVTQIIQNLETAREIFASWDDHIGLGVTGLAMAEVARAAGDPQMALQLLLQARVDMDEWKYDWGAATTEWFIGEVYRHLDDEVRAAHHLAAGLKAYEETGDRLGMSGCIGGIAALLAARQEWGLAARFFGAASVLRERTQSILPPTHQIDHDRIAEIVFTMIGTEEYLRGRADDQEFAVSEALRIARALETGSPIVADLLAPTKGYSRARQQVLVQLAQGKEVKQISHALNRGVSTIYRHIDAMMEDLNCKSIDELRERAKLVARPAAAD
jgi:tetratricopeptide (TPR) repeat protein